MKRHIVVLAFIVIGIILAVNGFGQVPIITIALALCFSVYAAIKKGIGLDSIVSTTMEIAVCVPFAIAYILLFCRGEGGLAELNIKNQMILFGAGIITAMPMLLYAVGLNNLPMFTVGIMQYLSPTLSVICAVILGETLTAKKLLSFAFILTGMLIYVITSAKAEKKQKETDKCIE